jgi:hypothetical protein
LRSLWLPSSSGGSRSDCLDQREIRRPSREGEGLENRHRRRDFFGLPLLLAQILSALSLVDLTTILPEPWGARLALTVSLAMIFMRFTVTGPVGAKGDEKPDADTKAGD